MGAQKARSLDEEENKASSELPSTPPASLSGALGDWVTVRGIMSAFSSPLVQPAAGFSCLLGELAVW